MKNKILSIFGKVMRFFERLSSRPNVGGVYVSSLGVQYVSASGGAPKMFSLRFPPGVVRNGRIEDAEQFKNVLTSLHEAIVPGKSSEIVQSVVVLPSFLVYTQSFSVPNVGEDKLQESASLNLQTISPLPAQTSRMSWQMLEELSDRYDLLGAFVESDVVDAYESAFIEANFRPLAFEFPSLSVSRLLEKSGGIKEKNELLLQISSDGVNLSIVRKNKVYFDYFRSWASVKGEGDQISKEQFDQVVVDEVRKVMNFSMGKFKEKVDSLLLVAPGFEDGVREVIRKNFEIPVETLALSFEGMSPIWYVPLGAGMRDMFNLGERDEYINLGKETSEDLFFEEHLIGFVRLWRNALGIILGFFFIVFLSAFVFLSSQERSLEGSIIVSKSQINTEDVSDLSERAERFNAIVGALGESSNNAKEWKELLENIRSIAGDERVFVERIDVGSLSSSINVLAVAPNNGSVIGFKDALIGSGLFDTVSVPLLSIKELEDGSVGFSVNLTLENQSER